MINQLASVMRQSPPSPLISHETPELTHLWDTEGRGAVTDLGFGLFNRPGETRVLLQTPS